MRFEYKYIIPEKFLEPLRDSIMPFVEPDRHVKGLPEPHYTVRSIYFDTSGYDFYFEKIEGIKNRKKVRLRGYNEQSEKSRVFMEIKRKYDVPIIKYRAPLKFQDALKIFREHDFNGSIADKFVNMEGLENAKRFFYQVFSKHLRPVVLVVYEREPYLTKFDETSRITFDKNLRGIAYPALEDLYTESGMVTTLNRKFIMEVKFNNKFPGWMNPLITKFGLRKQSASKYVMTMDSVNAVRKFSKSTVFTHSKWYN